MDDEDRCRVDRQVQRVRPATNERILANPSSKRWKPLPVVELAQWLTTIGAQHGHVIAGAGRGGACSDGVRAGAGWTCEADVVVVMMKIPWRRDQRFL